MIKKDKEFGITEIIKKIRLKTIEILKQKNLNDYSEPVAFWIKKERLLNELGKEFTIILRTKGCTHALGTSGGCSMCGYIQDAAIKDVTPNEIVNQFNFALKQKILEIQNDSFNYVLKIFNSGSFFDDEEINNEVREHIYSNIANIKEINEVVIESRPEYITSEKLENLNNALKGKYVEIGIGLETINDSIRLKFINKGFTFEEFYEKVKLCEEFQVGIKVYLLYKPPFLNEQAAIDDCEASIKKLKKMPINTISINPMNIQKGTLVEYLWYQNRYRAPWFYSLFECIQKSLDPSDLKKIRILSDPSGAGSRRGIHNCLKRDCNQYALSKLKNFVYHQDLNYLDMDDFNCDCEIKYHLQKQYK